MRSPPTRCCSRNCVTSFCKRDHQILSPKGLDEDVTARKTGPSALFGCVEGLLIPFCRGICSFGFCLLSMLQPFTHVIVSCTCPNYSEVEVLPQGFCQCVPRFYSLMKLASKEGTSDGLHLSSTKEQAENCLKSKFIMICNALPVAMPLLVSPPVAASVTASGMMQWHASASRAAGLPGTY